jgi:hypothetical protein
LSGASRATTSLDITNELNPTRPPFLTLAQNIGQLVGAIFGRKWAINLTLGVTGVFGLIAAGTPSFAAIGSFAALQSFGVGGLFQRSSAYLHPLGVFLLLTGFATNTLSWVTVHYPTARAIPISEKSAGATQPISAGL